MSKQRRIVFLVAGLLSICPIAAAHAWSGNKSVTIDAGSHAEGASTVNGSITVGRGATVTGSLETVNGAIRVEQDAVIKGGETVNGGVKLGAGVKAEDISSVNGAIRIDENVTIDGELSVVNGRISIASGSKISGDISNVNGEIQIAGAEIRGDLSTVNGDVALDEGAILRGTLTVQKPGGTRPGGRNSRTPKVIIGPGSEVVGEIVAEREIELYISESAKVGGVSGVMSMEKAIRFSGNRP